MFKIALDNTPKHEEADALIVILGAAPPNKGYSIAELRAAVRLIDKIEEAKATSADAPCVLLEKEEHAFLKARIEQVQWARATPEIVALVDKIEKPETVKIREVS